MSASDGLSAFPEDRRPAVARALAAAFGTTTVESATLLAGGLSSALVYRITVGDKPYVLRLIQQANPFNDPACQFHCMRLAADHGIAPPVHYTDAADAVSITEFVDGTTWSPRLGMSRDELRRALAGTIRTIHRLPVFPPSVDYFEVVDGFVKRFQTAGMLPAAAAAEHLRLFARARQAYPRRDPDRVSSHNDLNPHNLLVDGTRIWVIDWEVACSNDRYVDLANAANFYLIDAPEEEIDYLATYFGETPSDDQRARFFLMRQICRMLTAMVFLNMAAARTIPGAALDPSMEAPSVRDFYARMAAGDVVLGSPAGQQLYAKVLLGELLRDMNTPRFDESIWRIERCDRQ